MATCLLGSSAFERPPSYDDNPAIADKTGEALTIEKEPFPPLGEPREAQDWSNGFISFFRQWGGPVMDLDAIATQPSVFDDPITLEAYRPPPQFENTHRFDPAARWTWREEKVSVQYTSHLPSDAFITTLTHIGSCPQGRLKNHDLGLCYVFCSRVGPQQYFSSQFG